MTLQELRDKVATLLAETNKRRTVTECDEDRRTGREGALEEVVEMIDAAIAAAPMREPKFKNGDRVRVLPNDDGWEGTGFVAKIFDYVRPGGREYRYDIEGIQFGNAFDIPERVLTAAEEERQA